MAAAVSRSTLPPPCARCAINRVRNPISPLYPRTVTVQQASASSSIWERVVILKKHPDGTFYKFRDEKGRETASYAAFEFIVHNPTGTLYRDEPLCLVWEKCFLIALANPVFMAIRMTWYTARIFLDTAAIGISYFKQMRDLSSQQDPERALKNLTARTFTLMTSCLKDSLWRVVSAPIYALGVEMGALVGLLAPYHGRVIVGQVEKHSQNGGLKKHHCCLDNVLENRVLNMKDYIKNLSTRDVCFLAFCFQDHGSLSPSKNFVLERRPIQFL